MREPTLQEIAKFKRACKALDEPGREMSDGEIYAEVSRRAMALARSEAERAPSGEQFSRVGQCVAFGSDRIIIASANTVEWADRIVAALARRATAGTVDAPLCPACGGEGGKQEGNGLLGPDWKDCVLCDGTGDGVVGATTGNAAQVFRSEDGREITKVDGAYSSESTGNGLFRRVAGNSESSGYSDMRDTISAMEAEINSLRATAGTTATPAQYEACGACDGTGNYTPGCTDEDDTCEDCKGTGEVITATKEWT